MKKITFTFLLLTFYCQLFSQTIAIPDANFEQALVDLGVDTNGLNGNILNSDAESTISLIISNKDISDMTGIEAFTNLEVFYCSQNNLTSLDLTYNVNLQNLVCWQNNLTSLDLSTNTQIYNLSCDENNLTSLDISNLTTLYHFYCGYNPLTTLDVSANTTLITLDCNGMQLTELDLSNNNDLLNLYCDNNQLTSLYLDDKPSLVRLSCKNNELTLLDINNGNNTNVTLFRTNGNQDLSCIEVDNETFSTTNWTTIDTETSFSEECNFLSVEEFGLETIQMYPNPTSSYLTIKTPSQITITKIEVYSLLGKKVLISTTGNNTLNVNQLASGIYVINITSSLGNISKKLIID
ncbi:T9SS type A sorting domain-containing protein [Psychroserpens sp.]